VKLDYKRLGKYLDEIAAETIDIEKVLNWKGEKSEDLVQQDPYILKSLKYSTIVIAEAVASTLQHILAKKYNVVIDGYMAVFSRSKENKVISIKLLTRLQPFFRFRNMLVHQYWRVDNKVFESNLRDGLNDFRTFVNEIRKIIKEDCEVANGNQK
jgi:uncharacterized protein YutE (UPF0331/DUF86 family)